LVGLVRLGWNGWVGKVGMVGMVENTYMCGKVLAHYEPGWSPIWELVAAAVTYSQSRHVIDGSQRATPSTLIIQLYR